MPKVPNARGQMGESVDPNAGSTLGRLGVIDSSGQAWIEDSSISLWESVPAIQIAAAPDLPMMYAL